MLLQFTVNNFKSIKDTVIFSMATVVKDSSNSFQIGKFELLKSTVIYGANASGKSNFLKAMNFMSSMVLNHSKIMQSTDILDHHPFKLSTDTEDSSSTFEIVCFIDDIKYRYGFEADKDTVYEEWLYASTVGKEAKLFHRYLDDSDYVNSIKFKEGYKFFDKNKSKIDVLKNQLFIWKCDQNDGTVAKGILNWFSKINYIESANIQDISSEDIAQMKEKKFKSLMTSLIKTADIGIDNFIIEEKIISREMVEKMFLPDVLKKQIIENKGVVSSIHRKTYHNKYDENNVVTGQVTFDLHNEESQGTRKLFNLSVPILNALREGEVLIIDELDASLHPMLTKHLIQLFHNEATNTKKAQLIFSTHDTNMISQELFKKDQVWLTQKDRYGSTNIYSLAEIKGIKKNEKLERQYMKGRYGGVPYIDTIEFEL